MIIERWRQIESLFHAAYEKPAEERERFLDEACGSDQTLRREVESLLAWLPRVGRIPNTGGLC